MTYTELQITSNFSFLRGASHPEELMMQAALLGYKSIAITDRNSVAGMVRAHIAAKENGIRLITGCRIDIIDGPDVLVYPINKQGYSNLCELLTVGNLRAPKGECYLYKNDLFGASSNMKIVILPPSKLNENFDLDACFMNELQSYKEVFSDSLFMAASHRYAGNDNKWLYRIHNYGQRAGIPIVATNDVHYHLQSRRQLQDILTCIREKCTINEAGYLLQANAERYLKPQEEMLRIFRQYPGSIINTGVIADACLFSLDELKYEYPEEITTGGRSPQEELTALSWAGAEAKFGHPLPDKIHKSILHELKFIDEMQYAPYFLTVYDIVKFARSQNILCQGRGSAANSAICYCLDITSVDPTKFDLLFERFISSSRNEPPDIDVDFEHERREEVIQYIYRKYGRRRAGIVATVTRQHQRGAIRDVGKVMGLSEETISRLSGLLNSYTDGWFEEDMMRAQGVDPDSAHLKKVLELTREFMGFPRQLGQHTGGFVIARDKLSHLVPVMNARMADRTCIEWNKDDIEALGFMKIDILALGMLTCIRKAFDLTKTNYGLDLTLANIPQDDPAVYDMICHADTIGVFQIESRAQQSMLPRLKPRCFYDLVIEVAIVRPGPIQGDMVHPYLRRRNGEEKVEYPSPELKEILGRTLGVPLFQEQAMKIAMVAAGFNATEADELRRSMATFKVHGMVSRFEEKLTNGMIANGYTREYAKRVFRQLEGFGSYGFPESHAASFAQLVYVSSWLKWYYPDVFACALLNSLPMGFYQPAQIIADAKKHGVEVRAADVNHSYWDHSLEKSDGKFFALRLGFRIIKGMRKEDAEILIAARKNFFATLSALRDAGLTDAALEKLADADAFRSIGLDRRQALWEICTKDRPLAMYSGQMAPDAIDEEKTLPQMHVAEHVVQDYAATSLSLKAHPLSFIRYKLESLGVVLNRDLSSFKNGDDVKVAGLVLVRQRPGTAAGVCFMTIEDETGYANAVVFENIFEKFRKEVLLSKLIMLQGTLQIEGEVIHVIVKRCFNFSGLLRSINGGTKEPYNQLDFELKDHDKKHDTEKIFSQSRDFR